MCGIAGFYLIDPEGIDADWLMESMLAEIEHRGGDATGFVALGDKGVLDWQKAACDVSDFNAERRRVPKGTRMVICHTRWATQGSAAFIENNHPIRRGPMYIIHNGHVINDDELLKKAGRKRYGRVDSEAIAALLAKKDSLAAISSVMERIEGDAAVAAVDEREPTTLALSRGKGSPLYVLSTRRVVMFGSTANTVLRPHREVIGSIADKRAEMQKEGTTLLVKDGLIQFSYFAPKERKPSLWEKYVKPAPKDPVYISQSTEVDDVTDDLLGLTTEELLKDSFTLCDGCGEYEDSSGFNTLVVDGVPEWLCHNCHSEWSVVMRNEKNDYDDANEAILKGMASELDWDSK